VHGLPLGGAGGKKGTDGVDLHTAARMTTPAIIDPATHTQAG